MLMGMKVPVTFALIVVSFTNIELKFPEASLWLKVAPVSYLFKINAVA